MNDKLIERWAPVAICLIGLVVAHHEMVLSGFAVTQNDLGDTRFVHYLLEHALKWALGDRLHRDFWSPPFFAPTEGHLAWSENMAGAAWVYFPLRLFFEPHNAFQAWGLALGVLNFAGAYLLLKRAFGFSAVGSSVGAVLFAFSAVRINQTMHWQLFPHFYTPVAAYAAYRLANASQLTERARVGHIALLAAMTVGQLWASIYLGWFLVFVFVLGLGLGLCWEKPRRELWALLKGHPYTLLLAGLLSIAALYPMGWRYYAVAKEFGGRPYEEILTMLPVGTTWLHLGKDSWLWGQKSWLVDPAYAVIRNVWWAVAFAGVAFGCWRATLSPALSKTANTAAQLGMWLAGLCATAPALASFVEWQTSMRIPMEHEQRCGFGLFASALAIGSVLKFRKEPKVIYVGVLTAVLLLITTLYAPDGSSPWRMVHEYFPAAQAIRAVARASIVYMLGLSVAIAAALSALEKHEKLKVAVLPLGALLIYEQGYNTPAFSKELNRHDIAAVEDAIEPGCEVFVMSPVQGYGPYWKYQLDAMWASMDKGIPTLNGYSGQNPKDWPLSDTNLRSPYDEQRVAQAAQQWLSSQPKLAGKRPCWARVGFSEGPNVSSEFVSQEVPMAVKLGQSVPVSLTFKNTGPKAWPVGVGIRLGAEAPQDNDQWGLHRVELPQETPVGQTVTFRFEIRPSGEPGKHAFQWRMVADGVQWIGALSKMQLIDVLPSDVPPLLAAPAPDAGM